MEDNIIIRKVTSNDSKGLIDLYDRVWPGKRTIHERKVAWMLETSEKKGCLAELDGKIIGSRTCFHSNLYWGDSKKIESVQFGDSCVDPSYRRLGLFSRMNKAFLDDYFVTGDEVIYNVSVDASRKAYEKQKWVYIDSLSNIYYFPNFLRFVIKSKGQISRLSGSLVSEKVEIPNISDIPETLLSKRNAFVGTEKIHIKYDKDTLKLRLQTDSNIRLFQDSEFGVCFYKIGEKNGLHCLNIGEMFLNDYTQKSFNRMLKKLCELHKPDVVNISITHAHPMFRFYKRKGFICNPKRKYLNLGVRVESDKMKSLCLNPNNWAISDLDIDTF